MLEGLAEGALQELDDLLTSFFRLFCHHDKHECGNDFQKLTICMKCGKQWH